MSTFSILPHIASIATKRLADTLIIITGDADIVPALKLARQEGMIVGLDPLWNPIQPELSEHVDFIVSKANKQQKDESCATGDLGDQDKKDF